MDQNISVEYYHFAQHEGFYPVFLPLLRFLGNFPVKISDLFGF